MSTGAAARARARDLGVAPGTLSPGPANAITDVPGIRVGHATVIEPAGPGHGEIRTGVTAVVHDALLRRDRAGRRDLPAGLAVYNGFGKMTGSTQIDELGTVETPVLLTSTLSVFRVADALLSYLRARPEFARAVSLNPVVAETNDGYLSDIWARRVSAADVAAALDSAAPGPVAEGCVGAGTGTRALGFKAGIGTSSRRVPGVAGQQATVGALVQANFTGLLTVAGRPVRPARPEPAAGNSCVIVLATDAGLDSRTLGRLASRAFPAMARTGSDFSGRSGDYALAISTAAASTAASATGSADQPASAAGSRPVPGDELDLLFAAAMEATEEAILNSLCQAVTTTGYRGRVSAAVPLAAITGSGARRCGS
jgi:D-aminopeptidase